MSWREAEGCLLDSHTTGNVRLGWETAASPCPSILLTNPPPTPPPHAPHPPPPQIDAAFEHLMKSVEADGPGARYVVSIASGGPPGVAEPR
jgi:hypothetical protein